MCFHLPYRQTEGVIKATGNSLHLNPSYGHICKRISNRLNVEVNCSNNSSTDDDGDDYIIIAVNSTGIKVTNRDNGCLINRVWKEKGYLKIHVAVNIRPKKSLH